MAEVEIEAVSKRFDEGEGAALSGVSIAIERGELMVVVGPSGCGKSTTLRIVAGLEHADGGAVRIGGRSMQGVAPQDRDVAMVFQGYALYPQMTVRENIEFPLKMRRVARDERAKRSREAAAMLKLEPLMNRLPGELSGGERQRVAMGRAIVRRPRVFLFDEPLSNLDASLRQELRVEIGVLVRRLGVTAMYVTHDQVEAMTLADRICVMKKGEVLQIGAPREIYERPATSFVATFMGSPKMNLLEARAEGTDLVSGPFRFPRPPGVTGERAVVGVRAEDVRIVGAGAGAGSAAGADSDGVAGRDAGGGAGGGASAELEVVVAEPLGAETHLLLRRGDVELRARAPGFDPRPPGSPMRVSLEGARLHWFDAETEARLA
jgi:multiple sugar transport system ATP-binding protein